MRPNRPPVRFILIWLLICAVLLLLSYGVESLVYSGVPGAGELVILSLSYLTEMARYVPVIAISGLLIASRRTALLGVAVLLVGQYAMTEYRYSGVEGLGLYGLQLVSNGSVTISGHALKAVYPLLSLLLAISVVRPMARR